MPEVRTLQTGDEIQGDLINAGLGLEKLYGAGTASPSINSTAPSTSGGLESTSAPEGSPDGQAVSGATPARDLQAPAPSSPVPQPTSNIIDIGRYKPNIDVGGAYSYILQPPAEKTQKGFETLSGLTGQFSQQAEPFRTFKGIGGENIISKALQKGADWKPAENLAWAQYTGPTGLEDVNQQQSQKLSEDFNRLYGMWGQPNPMPEIGTIMGGVAEATSGLTPGEARFEAMGAQKSPEFRQSAQQLAKGIGSTREAFGQATESARLIGQERQAQEKAIREQAQQSLTGRQEAQYAATAKRAGEARTAQEEFLDQIAKFGETGNMADLNAIPLERFTFNPQELNTPARQTLKEAGQKWTDIWNKYPEIKDVPPLVPNISNKGWQGYTWDPNWTANIEGKKRWEEPLVHERAVARQHELEQAGFGASPETGLAPHFTSQTKYGTYQPLYYGGSTGGMWQPPDIRQYLQPVQKEGTTSYIPETPKGQLETFSTDEEKYAFNTINQIMHFLDSDIADNFPFAAAQIGANLDKFLEDEKLSLQGQKKSLTTAEKNWVEALDTQRRNYKKSRNKHMWGRLVGGSLAGGSLGLASQPWMGGPPANIMGNVFAGEAPFKGQWSFGNI